MNCLSKLIDITPLADRRYSVSSSRRLRMRNETLPVADSAGLLNVSISFNLKALLIY